MSLRSFQETLWREFLRAFAKELQPFIPPGKSGPPSAYLIREVNDMLFYALELPPATAADVVSWELSKTVNGVEEIVPGVANSEHGFEQGDAVSLKVRSIDDAGNVSDWSDPFEFKASDTLPPPKSGSPSMVLIREE